MALPQIAPGIYWTKPRQVVAEDGARISYALLADEGTPPDAPVVALLSGFLCPDTWWHHLTPDLLRAGYRVVMLHYRGIGSSTAPERLDPRTISIERFAGDVLDVLHDAGVERVALIGHSMGGQVMVEVARRIPDRITALVSITGAYRAPTRDLYGLGWLIAPLAGHLVRVLRRVPGRPWTQVWRTAWERLPFLPIGRFATAFSARTPADVVASYVAHAASLPGPYVVAVAAAMHAHDGADVLPSLDVPALVIAGDRDPFTPQAVAERMAALLPDAELLVVEGGSHGAILEEPALISRAVLAHLAAATGAPPPAAADPGRPRPPAARDVG